MSPKEGGLGYRGDIARSYCTMALDCDPGKDVNETRLMKLEDGSNRFL